MRLYVREITHRAYVLAEDHMDPSRFDRAIVSDALDPDSEDFYFVPPGANPLNWEHSCLVYHYGDDDVTVQEAIVRGELAA